MAYIGRDIQYGVLDKQSFTADSSTTAFSLNSGVKNAKSLLVSVGGIIQEPDVAYTASGTTLTFSAAPLTGDVVYAIYLGKTLESGGAREQITFQNETGDGTTTPFTLSAKPVNAQSIMVTLNGVTQVPGTDYTVDGTTITFTTAPVSGMGILVYHLGSAAAIGEVADASVTNAKIVGMDASKLTGVLPVNTVSNTSIVSMDASKLTGTLPSSMEVDTSAIDQTIASLGMHVAVADNKASFNMPGVFIDQFEDDSGILTETDVDRITSGEYVSSVYTVITETENTFSPDANSLLLMHMDDGTFSDSSSNSHSVTNQNSAVTADTTNKKYGNSSARFNGSGGLTLGNHAHWSHGGDDWTIEFWFRSDDPSQNRGLFDFNLYSTYLPVINTSVGNVTIQNASGISPDFTKAIVADTWYHVAYVRDGTTVRGYCDGVQFATNTMQANHHQSSANGLGIGTYYSASYHFVGNIDELRYSNICRYPNGTSFTPNLVSTTVSNSNATGTLISKASTADAAVSSTSGVMVYEDAEGTNTLGTDLKIYFSANDGANWTEAASYGTPINFNGATKKMVKLGKTTLANTGTAVKMKAEWANQAAGTPESTDVVDKSSHGHAITVTGNVATTTTTKKYGTSAINCTGQNNTPAHIEVADSALWNFGSNDCTIEFWGRFNSSGSIANVPVIEWKSASSSATRTRLWYFDHTVGLKLRITDDSGSNIVGDANVGSTDTGNSGTDWTHFALVRNGDTWTHYRNGTANWSTVTNQVHNTADGGLTLIGKNGTWAMGGHFDDIRISNTARYTADFTPPAAAFTDDANTLLLLNGEPTAGATGKVARLHGWAVNY